MVCDDRSLGNAYCFATSRITTDSTAWSQQHAWDGDAPLKL